MNLLKRVAIVNKSFDAVWKAFYGSYNFSAFIVVFDQLKSPNSEYILYTIDQSYAILISYEIILFTLNQ